jgi:predicted transcriptional regulator
MYQNKTFKYKKIILKNMSQFIKYIGNSPQTRVLNMLITGRELEYSISDIASSANIGRATFYRMLEQLIKNKIIIKGQKIGHIQLYKLNLQNKNIIAIVELYDKILNISTNKEIEKQKLKV